MIQVGAYNILPVQRSTQVGVFLEDGKDGLLLPKRFVPAGTRVGDKLEVFVYHDSEDRLIATTQRPYAVVGEIAYLKAVTVTRQGAFLDWGLMKDLFVPNSKQLSGMRVGAYYLVKLYIDAQTGRVAATEKLEFELSNEPLTVKEKETVKLVVYRKSDIGYVVIINNLHTGVLHNNEIYRNIQVGDQFEGFIKHIRPDNKIDVAAGKPGYERVEDEAGKILRLLQENNGYLPYHDKSSPEEIYDVFGMSKKTFKMVTGSLYKNRKIVFTEAGIKLID
ncbi:MAG TPA: S1-like domain-containing RNA-binding protein [Chitinophagaceae bacterium]|nr:S1-like domain-containing RNA-binding protein [Chitinophagaceae bacterium]